MREVSQRSQLQPCAPLTRPFEFAPVLHLHQASLLAVMLPQTLEEGVWEYISGGCSVRGYSLCREQCPDGEDFVEVGPVDTDTKADEAVVGT